MTRHAQVFVIGFVVLSALSTSVAAQDIFITPEQANGPPIHGDGLLIVVTAPIPDPQQPIGGVAALYESGVIRDEGSVILRLDVDATGIVVAAGINSSSGFPALDHAAVKLAKTPWRFTPGKLRGAPAPMSFLYRVDFKKPA